MRLRDVSTATAPDRRQVTQHAIWTIGVGQCVSWGVLYYAFGVLLIPLEREFDVAGSADRRRILLRAAQLGPGGTDSRNLG